jgi:prepilin-type N-terminal cleavage/methylation domain-containing protein
MNTSTRNKFTGAFSIIEMMIVIAIIALLAAILLPSHVRAQTDQQGLPQVLTVPTNQPATISAATAPTNQVFLTFRVGKGAGLGWTFNASAGSGNATAYLYPTIDGTNYATTPWLWVNAENGTNILTVFTNWSPQTLAGVYGFKVMFSNATGGTFTNFGLVANRPNN